ncbi:MAG: mercury resistance protein [Dehalococcoidia bacterium]|nr:mercury resistance protein [Dehalococcoidia bacterium]
MATVTVLTCPCHLPILAAVLAGTALGGFLTEHMGVALAVLAVLFVASAWSAVRLFSREPKTARSAR